MVAANVLPVVDQSDEELQKRLKIFLAAKHPELEKVCVRASQGMVTLSGLLKSFHVRQLALSISSHVAGVRHIVDDIEVQLASAGKRPARVEQCDPLIQPYGELSKAPATCAS